MRNVIKIMLTVALWSVATMACFAAGRGTTGTPRGSLVVAPPGDGTPLDGEVVLDHLPDDGYGWCVVREIGPEESGYATPIYLCRNLGSGAEVWVLDPGKAWFEDPGYPDPTPRPIEFYSLS